MSDHMKILKMIEDGEITPDEGARMLQELSQSPPPEMEDDNSPMSILERVNLGTLSADEAAHLLASQDASADAEQEHPQDEPTSETPPTISDAELERWKQWWTIPLYLGVGVVVLATFWINSAYQNSGYGFWFFCAWVPMLIGLLLMGLAWRSRSGPWIHVRVRGPKEKVAISIPAPLGLTGWALNTFGHYIPHLERTSVDEIITALELSHKANAPLYVQVDEGDDGEKVEVFIG